MEDGDLCRRYDALASALAENSANNETDIGWAFAETTHEVREPFAAERHVDAHAIPIAVQRGLQVAANAIQHLELVPIRGNGSFARKIVRGRDHGRIMR